MTKCKRCGKSDIGESEDCRLFKRCVACDKMAAKEYDRYVDPRGAYRDRWHTDGSAAAERAAAKEPAP